MITADTIRSERGCDRFAVTRHAGRLPGRGSGRIRHNTGSDFRRAWKGGARRGACRRGVLRRTPAGLVRIMIRVLALPPEQALV